MAYASASEREPFRKLYAIDNEESRLAFLREGRGASYHEFELALGPVCDIEIVSCMPIWLRRRSLLRIWELIWRLSLEGKYEQCLSAIHPTMPRCFAQPMLEFAIRKR